MWLVLWWDGTGCCRRVIPIYGGGGWWVFVSLILELAVVFLVLLVIYGVQDWEKGAIGYLGRGLSREPVRGWYLSFFGFFARLRVINFPGLVGKLQKHRHSLRLIYRLLLAGLEDIYSGSMNVTRAEAIGGPPSSGSSFPTPHCLQPSECLSPLCATLLAVSWVGLRQRYSEHRGLPILVV